MRRFGKRVTVLASALSVLLVASVAFAAWTSSGSGSGQAASTTSVNSTITPAADGDSLYPGAVKSYTVTINNPNDYPVIVTSISAGSSNEVNGCAAGTVTSDAVTNPAGTIAAKGTATYTLVSRMAAGATDACKAQVFTLPLTATLSSNA
jgi:hypothetical protein